MAAEITEAFHVKMKIAPAPYKKEKRIQKTNTFKLFRSIKEKVSKEVKPP